METQNPLIWVVEDDPSTLRVIQHSLAANRFRTATFDTAEKALAALNANTLPSLIILDMLLPGMSGVDLIRLIKQNEQWSKIAVVVVTVLSRDEAPGEADDKSMACWVNKPFDPSNLIKTIQGIVSTAR